MSSWTLADHSKAERYANQTMEGVGIPDRTISEPLNIAMHYRRDTTGRERDYVFKTPLGRAASRRHQAGE